MKIARSLFFLVSILTWNLSYSQTVVKMDMPPQSDQPLQVVALFNEELPEGIPVVLGLMGYNLDGGITPYLCEWILNGEVISTNDLAVFTPQKGDDLALKVTDDNNCRASTSFNLKVFSIPRDNDDADKGIKVFPTVFTNHIYIEFPRSFNNQAHVRIFDMKGKIFYQEYLLQSTDLNLNLEPGTYFISIKTGDLHKVEKIIAQ